MKRLLLVAVLAVLSVPAHAQAVKECGAAQVLISTAMDERARGATMNEVWELANGEPPEIRNWWANVTIQVYELDPRLLEGEAKKAFLRKFFNSCLDLSSR